MVVKQNYQTIMFGFLSSILRALVRIFLVLVLTAEPVLTAFIAHHDSQPMPQAEANDLTS
jgi:hypothetical protein